MKSKVEREDRKIAGVVLGGGRTMNCIKTKRVTSGCMRRERETRAIDLASSCEWYGEASPLPAPQTGLGRVEMSLKSETVDLVVSSFGSPYHFSSFFLYLSSHLELLPSMLSLLLIVLKSYFQCDRFACLQNENLPNTQETRHACLQVEVKVNQTWCENFGVIRAPGKFGP